MSRIEGYGPSLVVLCTTVAVLVAAPVAVERITYSHTEAKIIQASQRLEDSSLLEQLNQAYRDVATVVEPSVVHISTEYVAEDRFGNPSSRASSGSGWIYDEHGHVVTNHHVIEGAKRIEVQLFDGTLREAQTVGSDPTTDIAVLKIPSGPLHPVHASRRRDMAIPVRQGDLVFAFGSPFDFRFSMSSGVVSGKGRSVGVIRDDRGRRIGYENFIQVDAAINPGNSGGPLTDYRGHVIGMNTAIATGRRGAAGLEEGQFAGIGLAIPMEMIEPVVSQLIQNGFVAKGYLGVSVVDRSRAVAEIMNLIEAPAMGLLVARVAPDLELADEGLQAWDVISHVDGQRISSIDQCRDAVEQMTDGSTVTVRLWRFNAARNEGRRIQLDLPASTARQLRQVPLLEPREMISEVMERLGFRGRGAQVVRMEPDGPALAAGIRAGDIITRVDDDVVTSVDQLRSVISSILPGQAVLLELWRYDPEAGRGAPMELEISLARLNQLYVTGTLPQDQARDRLVELGILRMSTSTGQGTGPDERVRAGVLVQELVAGSALSREISPGAVIVEVMEHPVGSVEEFLDALQDYDLRFGALATVVDADGTVKRVRLIVQ
jgi:serine protease Do